MVKFIKGIYAFTKEEVEELIRRYNNNEFVNMGRKEYVQLPIKKKTCEIDKSEFEQIILTESKKKTIYEMLKTSFYKLENFCHENYGTNDINTIKEQIKNKNRKLCSKNFFLRFFFVIFLGEI